MAPVQPFDSKNLIVTVSLNFIYITVKEIVAIKVIVFYLFFQYYFNNQFGHSFQ